MNNNIKWNQVGTRSFISEGEMFAITPTADGGWRLQSKQKGKFYNYKTLESAFEGARNISNFYGHPCVTKSLALAGRA